MTQTQKSSWETLVADTMAGQALIQCVLSAPRREGAARKIVVRPIAARGATWYQFETFADNKATHRNLSPEAAQAEILVLLDGRFRDARFFTTTEDVFLTWGRGPAPTISRKPASKTPPPLTHDRPKNRALPPAPETTSDDPPADFLVRLGIMGPSGKVLAARYDKYRQINRFVEMVADVFAHLPPEGALRVVDFGCGKAYLTFALYHYLRCVKGREVAMVGVDVKTEVLAECETLARDLHYDGLTFVASDIESYPDAGGADMVVALHACDTATDDALARAVRWQARVILAVPCCQHELFRQINAPTMRPLLKHGLVKERFAALLTDALRASLLETQGYATQLLEFVETEHTPKNLLIRAVRHAQTEHRDRLRREYETLRDFWGVHPALETLLASAHEIPIG